MQARFFFILYRLYLHIPFLSGCFLFVCLLIFLYEFSHFLFHFWLRLYLPFILGAQGGLHKILSFSFPPLYIRKSGEARGNEPSPSTTYALNQYQIDYLQKFMNSRNYQRTL